jgi:hypothetical protein
MTPTRIRNPRPIITEALSALSISGLPHVVEHYSHLN